MKLQFDQTTARVWRATTDDGYRFTVIETWSGSYETIVTHRDRRGILSCQKFLSLAAAETWLDEHARRIELLR
jgi:hypothetical protein